MRLGFVVYGGLETRTGGFRYDRRLLAALRERGYTVDVVELPWRQYPAGLLEGAAGRPQSRIAEVLDGTVDAVLQDELAHPSLVGCNGRLRTHVDGPLVSVVHHLRRSEPHPRVLDRFYRAVERRYLHTVDGAVCNSRATRTAVRELASPECLVAPPAGDRFDPALTDSFIKRRARDGPLRVVHVGRVVPRKGVDTLLEALGAVDDCELTVVGDVTTDRRYAARVRRLADRLGITDRVTFTGEVADDELASIFRRSHAVAIPSRHEGFGIAYLEGMSFGLPAIASTAGGANEIVTDGETGVLVAPDDSGAVAEALRALARDRDRLARMGRAARRRYERQPGWDETAAAVDAFVRRLRETDTEGGGKHE